MYLYHGTDQKSAKDIHKRGVDMSKSHKGYFGRGFYTATKESDAKENYADFAGNGNGIVLKFSLSPSAKILDLDKPEDFEQYKNLKWRGVFVEQLRGQDNFDEIMRGLGVDGIRDEGSFGGIVIYNPKVICLVDEMKFASLDKAIQYLSDLTGKRILVASKYQIKYWHEDAEDFDPWVTAEQADIVMKKSGVRPDRNKELRYIALDEKDNVIGAAFDSIINSEDYGSEYSFDVGVLPEHRGNVGMELIKACLEEANQLEEHIIRLWVVNPKLVKIMERKFGFKIDDIHSDGSAHMSKK